MKVRFDVTGSQIHKAREYDIATNTSIAVGQIVKLVNGLVVAAVAGETSPILGIAAESHTGTADALNERNNGTKILVTDSPTLAFGCKAPLVTATGGTATTIVDTELATFVDDDFVGGYVKLAEKVSGSAIEDGEGTVYRITASVAATNTLTIDKTTAGVVKAGDKFLLFPPIGFGKGNLAADGGLSLAATAALPIRVVGRDETVDEVHFMAALHELGNKKA